MEGNLKQHLLGLAFKPNIDDLRESPACYIVDKVLQNSNIEDHIIVEPNIESHSVFKLTDYREVNEEADIIVFLVSHMMNLNLLTFPVTNLFLTFVGLLNKILNYLDEKH